MNVRSIRLRTKDENEVVCPRQKISQTLDFEMTRRWGEGYRG